MSSVAGATATGADPAVVGPWLAEQTGEPAWREPTITLIAGGKSNLTYVVASAAGELVLRRPPTGHVLPTAHDMKRESTVLRALGPQGFPVPAVIAADPGGELLGAPFYVMEKVEGHIIRDELPAGYADDAPARQQIADRLVDTLARLHGYDPAQVGLGEFGRPAGYMARQVSRWSKQWEASRTEAVPALDALAADLLAGVPADGDHTIVHGDFRLDNTILDPADVGRVSAVLDWEMSTLGDPLADLGVLLVYWQQAGEAALTVTPSVTQLPGFPDRRAVAERYSAVSGRNIDRLPFYVAFAYFKLAVVVQGILARQAAGAMGGQDFGAMAGVVATLIDAGRASLADDSLG